VFFLCLPWGHQHVGSRPDLAVIYERTTDLPTRCPLDVETFIHEALTKRKSSLIPFAIVNQSVAEMVRYLKRHCSQSRSTAYLYIWSVHQYCVWRGADPDQLVAECFSDDELPDRKALLLEARRLDDYVGALQSEGYSPGHIANCMKAVKALFRTSGLNLELPYKLHKYVVSKDRAPTPEEIARLIEVTI